MSATSPVAPGRPVRIVMIGDSITDAGRTGGLGPPGLDGPLGDGWVALVALALGGRAEVANRGVSGDRLVDVEARWQQDVLALEPDLVSVAVGINDTRRRFDLGAASDVEEYALRYERLLVPLADAGTAIVLVEPWAVPVDAVQETWAQDLLPRREAVARLAQQTGATLVAVQPVMSAQAARVGAGALVPDGVHPNPAGHRVMADAWLAAVDLTPAASGREQG